MTAITLDASPAGWQVGRDMPTTVTFQVHGGGQVQVPWPEAEVFPESTSEEWTLTLTRKGEG